MCGPVEMRYFSDGHFGRVDVFKHDVVAYGNDGFDVGRLAAVDDVFCRQQMGGGNGGGSDFVERDDGEPELVAALQYEHHHVATANAERCEKRCRLVTLALDVGKRELYLLALLVGPEQGGLVGACPFVDYVVAEVEILWHVDLEVLHEILVGVELRFAKKFL